MKKSVMAKLLSLALASAMVFSLAACSDSGKKDKDSDDDEIEEVEDEDEDEDEEEEEEEEEEKDPTPTPEPTPTPTPVPASFFEEQGLTITPQGDYDLDTEWMYDEEDGKSGDTTVPISVEIRETTDGVEPGYKMIVADFRIDFTDKYFYDYGDFYAYPPEGVTNFPSVWVSVFDRYTGVSFEPGDVVIPVEVDGVTYDVTCSFEWNAVAIYEGDVEAADYCTVTVICPEDYDGTVFYIGHGSGGISGVDEGVELDFEKNVYTVDQLPYYVGNGYPYYFFTVDNK